jgi:hypothetical protein
MVRIARFAIRQPSDHPRNLAFAPDQRSFVVAMNATKILWAQVLLVGFVVVAFVWGATPRNNRNVHDSVSHRCDEPGALALEHFELELTNEFGQTSVPATRSFQSPGAAYDCRAAD